MQYFLNIFSPSTYQAFSASSMTVSGFRERHQQMAQRVAPGDILVCYLTKVSRWVGLLQVEDGPFIDHSPIFEDPDPFIVRFHVKPSVWLSPEQGLPIHEPTIWSQLSFTKTHRHDSSMWTIKLRSSLTSLSCHDGELLSSLLHQQQAQTITYPLSTEDERKLRPTRVRSQHRDIIVEVPEDDDMTMEHDAPPQQARESIQIQALLAEIGSKMGMQVWIPKADRGRVVEEATGTLALIDRLPLNYDETTLKTIEQIDVLWLRGRSIQRAFEVEHTTAVYSGILRMADLLALQPNMDIRLHIVAPVSRRAKVFQELRRPVFALLERGPLSDLCTYLSYDSVQELASVPLLAYLQENVLDEYEERADEAED